MRTEWTSYVMDNYEMTYERASLKAKIKGRIM